jgi:hypothetical protein
VHELGDRYSEAQMLTSSGDAYLAAGKPQQAQDAWHEALNIFDDLRRPEACHVRAKLSDPALTSPPYVGVPDTLPEREIEFPQ